MDNKRNKRLLMRDMETDYGSGKVVNISITTATTFLTVWRNGSWRLFRRGACLYRCQPIKIIDSGWQKGFDKQNQVLTVKRNAKRLPRKEGSYYTKNNRNTVLTAWTNGKWRLFKRAGELHRWQPTKIVESGWHTMLINETGSNYIDCRDKVLDQKTIT